MASGPKNGTNPAASRKTRPIPEVHTEIARLDRSFSTNATAGSCRSCTKNGTEARMPMAKLLAPSATAKPAMNTPVVNVFIASLASES